MSKERFHKMLQKGPDHKGETTYIMYHGTTMKAAQKIKRRGFIPSADGMLGPGIYVSRSFEKAACYPKGAKGQERAVLKLSVRVGRVKMITKQGHSLQKSWHEAGYDTAWVPPNCGMVKSGRQENCVWDPKRIRVLSIQSNKRESSDEESVDERDDRSTDEDDNYDDEDNDDVDDDDDGGGDGDDYEDDDGDGDDDDYDDEDNGDGDDDDGGGDGDDYEDDDGDGDNDDYDDEADINTGDYTDEEESPADGVSGEEYSDGRSSYDEDIYKEESTNRYTESDASEEFSDKYSNESDNDYY